MTTQLPLFETPPDAPEGLRRTPERVAPEEEQALVAAISALPLKPFEFHGFEGKRRVAFFGWRYDFDGRGLAEAEAVPPFLLPLRDRAAQFLGVTPAELPHVLVTEYAPGAPIGWHRDRPEFGDVVGVSLLSACRFRLRRRRGGGWEATPSPPSRAPPTCCRGPRAASGSTASRRSNSCAIR